MHSRVSNHEASNKQIGCKGELRKIQKKNNKNKSEARDQQLKKVKKSVLMIRFFSICFNYFLSFLLCTIIVKNKCFAERISEFNVREW